MSETDKFTLVLGDDAAAINPGDKKKKKLRIIIKSKDLEGENCEANGDGG